MLTFVKRSSLPPQTRGKVGGMSVVVSKNGQLMLSSLASKFFHGVTGVLIGFEGDKVFLVKPNSPVGKKADPKDITPVRANKKTGALSITASRELDHATEFGASGKYDFRASGNQSFGAVTDEKQGWLTFELPNGKLTPKPVVKRVKKVKVAGTSATLDTPPALTDGCGVDRK